MGRCLDPRHGARPARQLLGPSSRHQTQPRPQHDHCGCSLVESCVLRRIQQLFDVVLDIEGDVYAVSLREDLAARLDLRLDPRALAGPAGPLSRLGVLGPAPSPPPEEPGCAGRGTLCAATVRPSATSTTWATRSTPCWSGRHWLQLRVLRRAGGDAGASSAGQARAGLPQSRSAPGDASAGRRLRLGVASPARRGQARRGRAEPTAGLTRHQRWPYDDIARRHGIPLHATGLGHLIGIHCAQEHVVDYRTRLLDDRGRSSTSTWP